MPSELYTVRLDRQAISRISAGVEGLPYREAAPVIAEFNAQLAKNMDFPCASCAHAQKLEGIDACGDPSLSQVGHLAITGAPVIAKRDRYCNSYTKAKA